MLVCRNLINACSNSSIFLSDDSYELLVRSLISLIRESRTFIISVTFKIGAIPLTKSAISFVKICSIYTKSS
jgi:hypothetical protein